MNTFRRPWNRQRRILLRPIVGEALLPTILLISYVVRNLRIYLCWPETLSLFIFWVYNDIKPRALLFRTFAHLVIVNYKEYESSNSSTKFIWYFDTQSTLTNKSNNILTLLIYLHSGLLMTVGEKN